MLAINQILLGHRRLLIGDVAGSLAARAEAAEMWRAKHQYPLEGSLRLRSCELRGDHEGARSVTSELIQLGVRDPARYANVIAGPLAVLG